MNERLIKPLEAISQLQLAELAKSDGPSEISPELVPVDGWHRQPPEHVTVAAAAAGRYCPAAVEYVPAPQSVQAADPVDVLYLSVTHAMIQWFVL
jgi:hypothetical protein